MRVVFWSVGRDVFALLATGFVFRSPTGCVGLPLSWRLPINWAPHSRHKSPGWRWRIDLLLVRDVNDVTFLDNVTKFIKTKHSGS